MQGFSSVDTLPDGSYDAIVVDASDADDGSVRLELAISSGTQKGNTIDIRATGLGRDAIDALGLPVTLTVDNGTPTVTFD
jgi:hypothetical protein